MALYHSTFRRFIRYCLFSKVLMSSLRSVGTSSCKAMPVGRSVYKEFHHLDYSMQNNSIADVLLLGTLATVADLRTAHLSTATKANA